MDLEDQITFDKAMGFVGKYERRRKMKRLIIVAVSCCLSVGIGGGLAGYRMGAKASERRVQHIAARCTEGRFAYRCTVPVYLVGTITKDDKGFLLDLDEIQNPDPDEACSALPKEQK
jgi:hypothetical protein